MLIGRYYHTIEEQGRLSIPKQFRSDTQNWVVTRGLDGGLFVFPSDQFAAELEKLASRTFTKKSDRNFVRFLANDAYHLEVDGNGRVLLPEYLRSFAKLTKDVVVVGSATYLEIWNVQLYHQYIAKIEQSAEKIAEEISLENKHE